MFIHPPQILPGIKLQLELMTKTHKDELYHAAQDKEIWTYNATRAFGDRFYPWFDKALLDLQHNVQLPFVVRQLSDQKVIGSTRFYDINLEHKRIAIGYTWYIPQVWGTFVNPECKYLLLKYAFEDLHLNRVELVTDARNARSRAAIKKLGATEEGMLRQHMILEDESSRDSAIFSIIKSEWPEVSNKLKSRIK